MIKLEQIREGSVVMVRGGFGTEPARQATVEAVEANIKNGRAGIDYVTREGDSRWAYLDQVQSVVAY